MTIMKRCTPLFLITILLSIWSGTNAWASCETQTADVTYAPLMVLGQDPCNLTGSRKTTLTTLLSGEDQTNNLLRVRCDHD